MLLLVGAAIAGGLIGGAAFGLPGLFLGSIAAVMCAGILYLHRWDD